MAAMLLELIGALVVIGACVIFALAILNQFKDISKILRRIEAILKPIGVASSVEFLTLIDGQLTKVTKMMLKINQNLPVSVSFKDKFGNVAAVDGKPTWAVTAPELATIEVAEDGLSAKLIPTGTTGTLKVQVTADADLGEGVKSILGELEVQLLPGEAITVEIAAGTPEDQA